MVLHHPGRLPQRLLVLLLWGLLEALELRKVQRKRNKDLAGVKVDSRAL